MRTYKIVITLTDIKDLEQAKAVMSDAVNDISSMDNSPTINAEIIEQEVLQTEFRASKEVS